MNHCCSMKKCRKMLYLAEIGDCCCWSGQESLQETDVRLGYMRFRLSEVTSDFFPFSCSNPLSYSYDFWPGYVTLGAVYSPYPRICKLWPDFDI